MKYFALSLCLFGLLNTSSTIHAEDTKRYKITLKENSQALSKVSNSRKVAIKSKAEKQIEKSKIKNIFKYGTPRYSAELTEYEAQQLRLNPDIASVKEVPMSTYNGIPTNANYSMQTVDTPWHLDRMDQRNNDLDESFEFLQTGEGVNIYIVDSGIDNHSDFGRLTSTSPINRISNGHHIEEFSDTNDCNGHGTYMASAAAGLLVGVAKEATIHPVRVSGCSSSWPTDNAEAGLEWIKDNLQLPAVISMSFASTSFSTNMNNLIQDLHTAGAVLVAAADNASPGNPGLDLCTNPRYPALYDNVITVGASNNVDQKYLESFFGECIDVFAPGESVEVAQFGENSNTGNGYLAVSGTSPSAAYVAGLAALYLQEHPTRTPSQVQSAILFNATPDALSNLGAGSPNRLAFTNLDFDDPSDIDPIESSVTESFESNISWTNSGMFNWIRRSGTTPSGNTGPSGGDSSTHYAYLEASSGSAYDEDDTAILVSDYFDRNSINLIELSYHMFGSDIGELTLEIQNFGRDWKYITSLTGQQQNSTSASWKKTARFKPSYYGVSGLSRIRVVAKADGGFRGDIAIDNIKLIAESVPSRPTFTSATSSSYPSYNLMWTSVSGADRYEWKLSGGTWTSTNSESVATTLVPGQNTFFVRACNYLGCSSSRAHTVTYTPSSTLDARNDFYTTFVPQCTNKSNTFAIRPLTNDIGSNLQISSTSNHSSEISNVAISGDRLLITARGCDFSLRYTITDGGSNDSANINAQIDED